MKKISNDHRTRVTKLLIRKAFTNLLNQKSIQRISIKELCEAAGINRGTFYTHYTDIYDLLNQVEEEIQFSFREALRPLLYIDTQNPSLVKTISGILQYVKENSDLCTLTLGEYSDKTFTQKLINIAKEGYVEACLKYFQNASPIKIEYFCTFASSGCIGLLEKWVAEEMTTPAEDIAKAAEDIMILGLDYLK